MNRYARSSFVLRSSAIVILVSAGAALTACNGVKQSSYTHEGVVRAQTRLAEMKSGTEWQMAQQQYLAGDLDKALKTIDRSLILNPKVPKSHVLKGRILLEKGQLESAKESFEYALTLDPDNVDAHYFLGIVHERFSMDEKALAYYQKAQELDPNNPQYLLASAEMLVNLVRIGEAEQLLLSKKESFGYSAAIRQTLGHIAVLKGNHEQAAICFNDALLLAPEDPAILEDLARSQIAVGDFGDAEFNLARLLRIPEHKDRRDLQMLRARCLVSIDRPVEARTILQAVVNTPEGENDTQAWIELGNVAAVLKDKRNLSLAGRRIVGLAPHRFEGYFFRALHQKLESQHADALASLEQAINLCGMNTAPFVLRATILSDLGRDSEARQTLNEALTRNSDDPVALQMVARMDAGQGGTILGGATHRGETDSHQPTSAVTGVNTDSRE